MPDQYSGTIRSSAGSTHAYRWRTLSVDRFPSLQEEIDALRHSGQLPDPRIHQLHERSQFRLPTTSRPPARFLIATSAPLMIINLRFADRHIPVFMPPNYPFHGLTRAMLLEEIRRTIIPDSGHRVTGSITIFS